MELERSVEIARPPEEVFAFVSDPRNDVEWCRRWCPVEALDPAAAGPGARYRVLHRPIPLRPPREMDHSIVDWDPPRRIVWREDDGHDELIVTYTLEPASAGTRFTQHDLIERLGAPRLLRPVIRHGIGHDVAGQLRRLKRRLERT